MHMHHYRASFVGGSAEHRLCHFAGEVRTESPEDAAKQFSDAKDGGRKAADKYAKSEEVRNQQRVQQYNDLEKKLQDRFNDAKTPDERDKAAKEMQDVTEELVDALTRGMHNRAVMRPNRFDTPEEQSQVRFESAEYHKMLRSKQQERKGQRKEEEKKSSTEEMKVVEAKIRWEQLDLEHDWDVLMDSAGLNYPSTSYESAAENFLANIEVVRTIKKSDLRKLVFALDKHLVSNEHVGKLSDLRKNVTTLKDDVEKNMPR